MNTPTIFTRKPEVMFHHVRNAGRGKRDNYTFAIRADADNIYVGVAKCSRKDTFNKRTGRRLATGRLQKAWVGGHVKWSVVLNRETYGLTGDKFKREVVALVLPELKQRIKEYQQAEHEAAQTEMHH